MGIFIFFIIVIVFAFVAASACIASVFLLFRRRAVRNTRRIGAPGARRTARFRGGMWWPGRINANTGTVWLEFFDWGIRLRGAGGLIGLGFARLGIPVLELRYQELAEARLVQAPTHRGVRLRTDDDGVGEVLFWTLRGPAVLDHLQEHAVPVERAADIVPDPPSLRMSPSFPDYSSGPGIGPTGTWPTGN